MTIQLVCFIGLITSLVLRLAADKISKTVKKLGELTELKELLVLSKNRKLKY